VETTVAQLALFLLRRQGPPPDTEGKKMGKALQYHGAPVNRALFSVIVLAVSFASLLLSGCAGVVASKTGTTPPPSSLTVSITSPQMNATVNGTITVNVNATDTVGISSVQLKIDNTNSGTPLSSAPYSFSLNTKSLSNGNHVLTAAAMDTAANSATSAAVTVNVSNTTTGTPPTVTMTAPANGSTVSGTVPATASATAGSSPIASVQFQLDGANVGSALTAAPYSLSWNSKNSANGSHSLRAIATDTSNNSTTSAAVAVTVNNTTTGTPPTVTMTAPANGSTVSGTVSVSANATAGSAPIARVQFQLDGANVGSALTAAPYSFSWSSKNSANGSHSLRAIATDTSNNSTTSAAVAVTVNNTTTGTPPTTPTGLVATAISSSQITLSWTASSSSAGVTGYNIYRNGTKINTSTTTTYPDSGLTALTLYSYTVAAFDAAGNLSAQSSPASATTLAAGGGGSASSYGLGWNELQNTAFTNICPSTSTFTGIGGSETCKGVTDDWNGGWADWKRQRLEWWGGGHAGYYGNEVYFLDLQNRTIGRYTDPANNPDSQCSGSAVQSLVWQNTTPNVPHGYGGMAYVGDGFDTMFYTMGDMSRGTNTCPSSPVNATNGIRADAWMFNLGSINQAALPNPAGHWTPLDATTGGSGLTFQTASGCVGGCTNPGWGRFSGSVGGSEVGEYASTQTDQRTDTVYISDGISMYSWSPANPHVGTELAEGGGLHYFNGCATGSLIDTDGGTFVIYGNCGIRRFHIDGTTGTKWTTDTLDNSTTGCSVRGNGLSIGADYDYVQHIAVLWGAAGESTQIVHLFNPKDTAVTVNYTALGLSNHTVSPRTCETYTAPLANTSALPSLVPTQSGGTGEWGRFRFFHDAAQQDVFATCNNKDTNCFVLALNPPVTEVGTVPFANRCAAPGVIKCVSFDTAADAPPDTAGNACTGLLPCVLPDANGVFQAHIDNTVMASGGGSLRFDVPASAGQNSSGESRVSLGGRFGPPGSAATNGTTFYVQFRYRMDANMAALWKAWAPNGEGQKIFAVLNEDSSGGSTCQSEAIVYQNIFYRGFPQAGTNCVNIGLYEGSSPNIKYENGADYQCLQNQAFTDSSCAMMTWHPNEWYTFYCKYVLAQWDPNAASGWNTGHNTVMCWVAREGQPLKQFLNFTAVPLQSQNGLAGSGYNALKFYPYDTSRTGGATCGSANNQPCSPGKIWYDEVIVSTQPIPAPDGPTPPQ
jgi:hypothetical protein